MASVTLTEIWLHDASDPDSYVRLPLQEIAEQSQSHVEVREFAGGVLRTITRPIRRVSYPVRLVQVPSATVETLRGWEGTTLMLRDVRGRLVFGVFAGLEVSDWRGEGSHDVQFTFQTVTHSVEV